MTGSILGIEMTNEEFEEFIKANPGALEACEKMHESLPFELNRRRFFVAGCTFSINTLVKVINEVDFSNLSPQQCLSLISHAINKSASDTEAMNRDVATQCIAAIGNHPSRGELEKLANEFLAKRRAEKMSS